MATTTDLTSIGQGIPRTGFFYLYTRIDFSKYNMGISDDFKLFRTRDDWLIVDSAFRMPTASTSTGTVDLGTAQNGTEITAAADVDGANTAWASMTPLNGAKAACADGYIWMDCNTAVITDGVIEIMLLVMAGANGDSATD